MSTGRLLRSGASPDSRRRDGVDHLPPRGPLRPLRLRRRRHATLGPPRCCCCCCCRLGPSERRFQPPRCLGAQPSPGDGGWRGCCCCCCSVVRVPASHGGQGPVVVVVVVVVGVGSVPGSSPPSLAPPPPAASRRATTSRVLPGHVRDICGALPKAGRPRTCATDARPLEFACWQPFLHARARFYGVPLQLPSFLCSLHRPRCLASTASRPSSGPAPMA